MKRQWTKKRKSIRGIATSMMLAAGMCLSLAACDPGDPVDVEVSSNSMETMGDALEESTTEEPATTPSIQETVESSGGKTKRIDVSDWGEPIEEIGGDWNQDQNWDLLRIYSHEIAVEHGECSTGIQLSISGRPSYIAPVPGVFRFEDFLRGDFDGDKELEYAVVFDLGGAGANGSYRMLLLDYVDNQWVDVTGQDMSGFDGFSYDVQYDAADGGYRIIGKESGGEHFLPCDGMPQDPENTRCGVTASYNWTLVEGEDQDRLEIWQYVFSESRANHIGDVVTTISIEDGTLKLEDEIVVQESDPFCYVRRIGDQLEVLPIEHVYEGNTKRLEELQNEGWNLDELYFDDILRHYEVRYYEKMMTVSLLDTTRYYEYHNENQMIRVDQEDMCFREDNIENSARYHIYLDGDKVTCIMLDLRQ